MTDPVGEARRRLKGFSFTITRVRDHNGDVIYTLVEGRWKIDGTDHDFQDVLPPDASRMRLEESKRTIAEYALESLTEV